MVNEVNKEEVFGIPGRPNVLNFQQNPNPKPTSFAMYKNNAVKKRVGLIDGHQWGPEKGKQYYAS